MTTAVTGHITNHNSPHHMTESLPMSSRHTHTYKWFNSSRYWLRWETTRRLSHSQCGRWWNFIKMQ